MHSFPVPVLGFAVRFLSSFPDSLPQLFLRCLPSTFVSGLFPVHSTFFRLFLSRFRLLSLCFFLSVLPGSASQWLSRFTIPLSLPRFLPSALPDLSCFASGFSYSASCLFLFALPCFAPTAVPQVLTFCFRFRSFPFRFRILSSASLPVPATWLLFLLFLSLPCPASQWPFRCSASAFQLLRSFLFCSVWFPVLCFRFQVLSFSVSFLSSCLASLPQPLNECLPFPVSFVPFFSAFFVPFRFLSSASVHFRLLSFCAFFSLLPGFPSQWFFPVLIYPLSVQPVSMLPFQLWYSAFCNSFLRSRFRLTAATSVPQPSSFRLPASSP